MASSSRQRKRTISSLQQEEQRRKLRRKLFSNGRFAQKFHEDFSKRDILIGKKCDLDALRYVNFSNLFRDMDWETLIGIQTYIYPRLVRAFYACNETSCNPYSIRGTLKGVRFTLTIDSLNKLLDVPNEGLLLDPRPRLKNDAYDNHALFSNRICVGEGEIGTGIVNNPIRVRLSLQQLKKKVDSHGNAKLL
uniref:Uncharacterized protein n=1 Tax=Cannabis sativa TaxID=3483 RepID=A0A803PIW7_CANSA